MWGECEALSVKSYDPQASGDMCKSVITYIVPLKYNLNLRCDNNPIYGNTMHIVGVLYSLAQPIIA